MKNQDNWGGAGYNDYQGFAQTPGTPQPPGANPGQPAGQPAAPQPTPPGSPAGPTPAPAPAAPQPGQPVSPHDMSVSDLRALPPGVAPSQPPQNIPQPVRQNDGSYVLALPSGQRYTGRSPEEAYAQLANAQVTSSQEISSMRRELERIRRGMAQVAGVGEPGQPQKEPFDRNLYESLAAADPITAQWYLTQHMFGFDSIEEAQQELPQMYTRSVDYGRRMVISEFHDITPDFPATRYAVDKLMDFMQRNNLPFTAENLRAVHDGLKVRDPQYMQGAQPGQPGAPQPGAQPYYPQPNYAAAPPNASAPPLDPRAAAGPTGMHSFSPDGGFGAPHVYAPAPTPNPAPPAYSAAPPQAPPQPVWDGRQWVYPSAPAPAPVAAPVHPLYGTAVPGYPMVPLPMPNYSQPPAGSPTGPYDPNTVDTNTLRSMIETGQLR